MKDARSREVVLTKFYILFFSNFTQELLTMSGSATITVIVSRTKNKLKEVGAVSEETAKTPKELDLNEKWLKMSAHAGVAATQDGRYYLTSKKERQH